MYVRGGGFGGTSNQRAHFLPIQFMNNRLQKRGKNRHYMMPALTMSEIEDCQLRFQAAVDVIQSLPKNGSFALSIDKCYIIDE